MTHGPDFIIEEENGWSMMTHATKMASVDRSWKNAGLTSSKVSELKKNILQFEKMIRVVQKLSVLNVPDVRNGWVRV